MKREKNIFEKIIDREIPADILYEDEKVIAFLDAFPFEKGHLLVVPKKYYEFIWDMPEDEFLYLQKIVLKFAKNISKNFPNAGLNICQNNKKIAHQLINHVHFHLCPRVENKNLYSDSGGDVKYINEKEKQEYVNKIKIS